MKKLLYMLLATAFATSCAEFEIYDTPYPDSATINLSAEWTTLHDGDTAPAEYAIYNGGTEQKVSAQEGSTQTTYIVDPSTDGDFLVYNLPSGITVSGGVATLDNLTTNPEHLYYGVGSATLTADSEQDVTITTKRATAPLTINLSYDETQISDIDEVYVSLSGIATSRNLSTGSLGDENTLVQYPTLNSSGTITLSYTIFGTLGDKQELTLTLKTTEAQTKIVTVDLTSKLSNFNATLESLTIDESVDITTDYTLILTPEWMALHDGDTTPAEYTVLNNYIAQSYTTTSCQYLLKYSSVADFLVYNNPSGITIGTDGVATLDNLTSTPEHLYYGSTSATYEIGATESLDVTTYRATAPLTLKLSYEASEAKNIKSVTIELSGIAQTRDLNTDALSDSGTLTQYITSISEAESTLTLSYNILGTIGDSQMLKITFITTDDQTIIIESDLNTLLANLNDDMEPVTLAGDMNLPTDLETEGSISDWNNVNAGDGTAN